MELSADLEIVTHPWNFPAALTQTSLTDLYKCSKLVAIRIELGLNLPLACDRG